MVRYPTVIKVLIVCLLAAPALCGQTRSASDETALREFESRVAAYVAIHRRVEGPIPPLQASRDMAEVQRLMARVREGIRREVGDQRQGSLLTPNVVTLFRHDVAACLRVADLEALQADFIEHSVDMRGSLRIHQPLPDDTPMIPLPPRLLARLPALPEELRYVAFANALVLWDHHADMVVDIAPHVLDPVTYRTTGPAARTGTE